MKPIKFRAWDKNGTGWWRDLIFIRASDGQCMKEVGSYEPPIECDYVLMQYTGLHDKNGVEVYEGDILRVSQENPVVYDAVWHNDAAKFCLHETYQGRESWLSPFARVRDYEVIGNIYENPQLLHAGS